MSDELKLESVDALENLQKILDTLVLNGLYTENTKESIKVVRDFILKKDKRGA